MKKNPRVPVTPLSISGHSFSANKVFLTVVLLTAWMIAACGSANNPAEFSGGTDNSLPTPLKTNEAFEIPCPDESGETNANINFYTGSKGTEVSIKGRICQKIVPPPPSIGPHVVFLVDYSLSMETIDPATGGSCKRLEAAEALFRSLEERFTDNLDLVTVSLVAFGTGGNVVSRDKADLTATEFAGSFLDAASFCKSDEYGTNYEAAFTTTHTHLQSANPESNKYVFMITDGMPTTDNSQSFCDETGRQGGCRQSAANAARTLREGYPDANGNSLLNLNVLFLLNQDDQTSQDNVQDWLETDITSDSGVVRFARDAAEVAALIKDFAQPERPKPVGDLEAIASIEGVDQTPGVNLSSPAEGIWDYEFTVTLPGKSATYIADIIPTRGGEEIGVSSRIILNVRLLSAEELREREEKKNSDIAPVGD